MMSGRQFGRRVAQVALWATGWTVSVPAQPPARCVVIGAPHTSAWDLGVTLMLSFAAELDLRWIAEAAFFRGPGGPVLRSLGGIPVRRDLPTNFVAQMVAAFAAGGPLRLAIMPEGSRKPVDAWRTGFYHIAMGAGVPIVLGYGDYRRKVAGLGPTIEPGGDIQADFGAIKDFYAGIRGKNPHWQGPIRLG